MDQRGVKGGLENLRKFIQKEAKNNPDFFVLRTNSQIIKIIKIILMMMMRTNSQISRHTIFAQKCENTRNNPDADIQKVAKK